MDESPRIQLIEYARRMNRSGINQGTSGNLSVRQDEGMLITPSAVPYGELEPGDIVRVNPDGSATGRRKPSSEWRLHLDVYRKRTDAEAILHAHPVHCTALACLRRGIPAFHYMVAVAGGSDIRCAPYATFGTRELAAFACSTLGSDKAVLLAHHGLLTAGSDLPEAFMVAEQVEYCAELYWRARAVGKPAVIPDGEMDTIIEKFTDYGRA